MIEASLVAILGPVLAYGVLGIGGLLTAIGGILWMRARYALYVDQQERVFRQRVDKLSQEIN